MSDPTAINIAGDGDPGEPNAEQWGRGEAVDLYAGERLRAVEQVILENQRLALAGRVLELGCGAGRITGHLGTMSGDVHGIDISAAMVEHCRSAYPNLKFTVADLRDLAAVAEGPYDAIVAGFNVLDVLGEEERVRVLADIRGLLADGGVLIMSSHNRSYMETARARARVLVRLLIGSPAGPSPRALVRRLANRRRLRRLEHDAPGYALINDEAHDFSLLHYYISRDEQARQLSACGFDLLECRDLAGEPVGDGELAAGCPELHYVARR
ncbi:MAG TPA: class I SAM-dependent methyltransferase [Solirubrobacteraceae bacterium]|nr:class I SAM-dependent methyltransferase [Solirubrobacteraceae bacterium]